MEIWKDVIGYEERYIISSYGKVVNKKRNKELKPYKTREYLRVMLYDDDLKVKNFFIHRLVIETFIGSIPKDKCVNHINNIPSDNRVSNLEICSYIENACHGSKFYNKTSKFIGVCYDSKAKKWVSQININGKNTKIGRFDFEKDAFEARCKYEKDNNILNKYLC
jgi:hypothetical protein